MSTLSEIEGAADALRSPRQADLLRHPAERLEKPQIANSRLPLVPPIWRPTTQAEMGNAVEA
jgi:hypothetical protein